jgi:predicted RNase H-like nuclease
VPADILDVAAAGTAARIARGQATSLPDPPQPVEAGQPVAIWC